MAKKRNLKKSITISGKVLQSTNKVKNSDKVLISGLAILSTIRTMDSFGKLGEEVLERYGVKEIEEQGQYPYELRAAMHKAALDRFGEIALVAFGFYNAENYQKPLNDMVEKLIEENKNHFSSDDREVSFEALNSLWNNWIPGGTKMIRAVIIGGKDIPYGMAVERIQEDQYILRYTLAVEAHQHSFFQGIWEYQIARYFARYWDVSIEWLENKTETGYGFSTFYWMWSFKKNKSTKIEFLKKYFLHMFSWGKN